VKRKEKADAVMGWRECVLRVFKNTVTIRLREYAIKNALHVYGGYSFNDISGTTC